MLYIINIESQPPHCHELHHIECSYLPSKNYQERLGEYSGDKVALIVALIKYADASACSHCMPIKI